MGNGLSVKWLGVPHCAAILWLPFPQVNETARLPTPSAQNKTRNAALFNA